MAYKLTGDGVILRDRIRGAESERAGPPTRFTPAQLAARSNITCRRMYRAARHVGAEFIDTRPAFRAASSRLGYLHGPNDPSHPNETGYRELAEAIRQGMTNPDTARGCAELD